MSSIVAASLAVFAVIPITALVLYLIRRDSRAPILSQHSPDLLAECNEAEYVAAAITLKERNSQSTVTQEPTKSAEEAIDWYDTKEPYRPANAEPEWLFKLLALSKPPVITRNEHRVFIRASTLEQINTHLRSNTNVELGGLLCGRPYYAPHLDSYMIAIYDALPADSGKETATSFEYTADTWQLLTPKLHQMRADFVIVGSYHSHPGLGVFLSTTDINLQQSVFPLEWQIALVIDPLKDETGFFISDKGHPVKYQLFDGSA